MSSKTNVASYEALKPHMPEMQRQIAAQIREAGDATCDELEAKHGWLHQTISSQIRFMVQMGILYDTGEKRISRRNRPVRVYAVR